MSYTIALGTVGGGLWVGYNGGEKWRQIQGPMDPESNVRALAVDPRDSQDLPSAADLPSVADLPSAADLS